MELIKCSNCDTPAKYLFKTRDYNRNLSNEIFHHYQCSECKLIFISPMPKDLNTYYPDTYHFIPDSLDFMENHSKFERYKIEIVQQFAEKGRLLEIGPSTSCFAYLAKKAGFSVDAIEMDAKCCEFLNDVVGIHTILSDDPVEVLRQAKNYDVIALWHVIEHLPNVWTTLEAICSNVTPNGYVILAAPNPHAFQFRIMRRYWPHLDAPRHIMLIPIKLLVQRMERLGMQIELITTRDKGSLGWNTFGWEFFFGNLSSQRSVNKVLHLLGRIIAKAFEPIERCEGKGSTYTLVFKKVG